MLGFYLSRNTSSCTSILYYNSGSRKGNRAGGHLLRRVVISSFSWNCIFLEFYHLEIQTLGILSLAFFSFKGCPGSFFRPDALISSTSRRHWPVTFQQIIEVLVIAYNRIQHILISFPLLYQHLKCLGVYIFSLTFWSTCYYWS